MTTLFYDSFQNTNNWIGGNSQSPTITVVNDPKGEYQKAVNFGLTSGRPDSFSSIIPSNYKSFVVSFDYLGLPKSQSVAINLGCVISVSDGGSLTDKTMAYAGAVKNAYPPTAATFLDQYGVERRYDKLESFVFLDDDSNWHHYSLSFTSNNNNIRIALADFTSANYPEGGNAGDCYFANLLLTDSYGPSPFIATSAPENFRSISVDVLNQVADTVSYASSNAAININLASNNASGGYAEGDVLNNISNIIGSNYNDIILGNFEDNTLTGGNGNDTLTAGAGNDILIGGNGSDKFVITTEVATATISDFDISSDSIDLRLFSNLNSFQSVKNVAQYLNGNTVINLGSSKTLILSGINYNDLQESNFLIITSPPTQSPTSIPSYIPTAIPTTPTFSPTTLHPTIQPTIYPSLNPTYSPSNYPTNSPTLTPTVSPTIEPTLAPSVSPTQLPTDAPTKFPTLTPTSSPTKTPTDAPTKLPTFAPTIQEILEIVKGGSYEGGAASDIFNIDSPLAVSITSGEGIDNFIINPHKDVVYTITDFNPLEEQLNLLAFSQVHAETDLNITQDNQGSALINLPDEQIIKLLNISPEQIHYGNFIFSIIQPTLQPTDSSILSNLVIGIIAGAGGALLLGGLCCCFGLYTIFARNENTAHMNNNEQQQKDDYEQITTTGAEPTAPPLATLVDFRVTGENDQELTGDIAALNMNL